MNNRWKITILPAIFAAVVCSSCSREPMDTEATSLTIETEIASSKEKSRTVISDYQREGSFLSGDKIRITQKKESTEQTADYYTEDGTTWKVLSGTNDLTLTSGATYEARYPADYSGITQDQNTKASYLSSDLLAAPATSSYDGKVSFTGDKKFVHKNVKLTLVFQTPTGSTALDQTMTFRLNAPGLRTGGANDESLILLRPDTDQYIWSGIAFPQGTDKDITIVLTSNNVEYVTKLSCPFVGGIHYKYTLTVRNDILMPQGEEIVNWVDNAAYSGGFN